MKKFRIHIMKYTWFWIEGSLLFFFINDLFGVCVILILSWYLYDKKFIIIINDNRKQYL